MARKYELDLRDYVRILRKRKVIVIFTTLMLGIFSFVFATLQKPVPLYKASSSVKIEKSSTMAGLYLQSVSYSEYDTLETQATIIRSYPIMEIVAKRLELLDKNLSSNDIRQNNKYLNVVLDLKDKVTTAQEGNTNIVNITITSEEPDFCQLAATTIAEVFKEQNTYEKNKRAISGREFIEGQLKIVSTKLKDAEEKVKTFREENKLVSLPDQSRIVLDQLTRAEAQYNELTKSLSEMELMAKQLKEQRAIPKQTLEGVVAERVGPIFQRLNTQLLDLNVKKDSLLLLFTEKHPEVQDVNEQIANITKNMISQLMAQKNTLQRAAESLKVEIEKLREQLKALPESGLKLARLERDVKLNAEVYTMLEQKHQEALIQEAEKIEEVTIVKPALKPTSAINPPQTASVTFVGAILGMVLGLVFAFIMETMDTSIGTIEDVESYLEVPVVGIIPFIAPEDIKDILLKKSHIEQSDEILGRNARLVTHFAPKSTLAESYRALRTNIQFSCLEREAKLLIFTSSSPGEGKSSTTMNLAMVMAQAGSKVLLVDADLRKPMVNKVFGLDREPGLSDVILGNYEFDDVIRTVTDIMMGKMGMEDIMTTPGIDNLSIITSGTVPPNPSELLNSPRIPALFAQLREKFDIVLIDTTPILPATDAAILGSKADGVVIVYQVGKIARGSLKRAKVQMDNVKAKVIGIVLNGLKPEVSLDYQDYRYESYYAYGAEHAEPKKKSWIPIPEFIKRLIPEKKEKGEKKDNIAAGILKMLTAIAAVSFMLLGLFYEVDYESIRQAHDEREKAIPIASMEGTPPSAPTEGGLPQTGGPETKTGEGGGGGWRGSLFSKRNIYLAAIITATLAIIGLISAYLIRKRREAGGVETEEEAETPSEEEVSEAAVSEAVVPVPEGINRGNEERGEEAPVESFILTEEPTASSIIEGKGLFEESLPDLGLDIKTEEPVQAAPPPESEKKEEEPVNLFEEFPAEELISETGVVIEPEPEVKPVLGSDVITGEAEIPLESAAGQIFEPPHLPVWQTGEETEVEEVEDVLEGIIVGEEIEDVKEPEISEAQIEESQVIKSDLTVGQTGDNGGKKETLLDSNFKGFDLIKEDESAVKEKPVDFSDMDGDDIFEGVTVEDSSILSTVSEAENETKGFSPSLENDMVSEKMVEDESLRQEIKNTEDVYLSSEFEPKEEGFKEEITEKKKSADDQIKEWEKLLLID
ncbi:MAG: polysaccharide biosynthesis tyrosine autokinase [Nitrospinae bacterium]|nr:polysaccharide biosynthesis tyrosine autokinase [Nitrospinota bacterium]